MSSLPPRLIRIRVTCSSTRFAVIVVVGLLALQLSASRSEAQTEVPQPTLYAVFPAGAECGGTVRVKIVSGDNLDTGVNLRFSHPGIIARPVMRPADRFYPDPRPVPGEFDVSVAADVPVGVHEVRVETDGATSNARRFVVGDRGESNEVEPNDRAEQATTVPIGSTVNGQFEQQGVDYFRFHAKSGQRLLIECEAERVDSRGDASLELFGPGGNLWGSSQNVAGSDPVIALEVPEEGDYLACVHELSYASDRNAADTPYRLSIFEGPWVDFIDPPVARRGGKASFTLYGRNLGGKPTDVSVNGRRLEALAVEIEVPDDAPLDPRLQLPIISASVDIYGYRHRLEQGVCNVVGLELIDRDAIEEVEPNDKAEDARSLEVPSDVVGRFDRRGDIDRFRFEARKEDRLWIDVACQRLGVPADPLLVIQQLSTDKEGRRTGRELMAVDDQPRPVNRSDLRLSGEDASALFVVPEDGEYQILIRDQFGSSQGGPNLFYHLTVEPAREDFRLVAVPGLRSFDGRNFRQNNIGPLAGGVPRGGATEIRVLASRIGGFEGPIEIRLDGLPAGLSADPVVIGSESMVGSLIVRAAGDAESWTGDARIVGKAVVQEGTLERDALAGELLWNMGNRSPARDRLSRQLVLSVDDTMSVPVRVETKEKKVHRMARGGKLPIEFSLRKQADDFKSQVSFSVVDLPSNRSIRAGNVNVNTDKPDFQVELDISTRAPLGRMSAFLLGTADIDHEWNVEAARRAKDDQQRISKTLDQVRRELRDASSAKSESESRMHEARRKVDSLVEKQGTSDRTDEEEAALADARAELDRVARQAEVAKEAEASARELVEQGEREKREIDQLVSTTSRNSRKQKRRVPVYSDPFVVEVVEFPLELSLAPSELRGNSEEEIELTVELRREFGFDGDVELQWRNPDGARIAQLAEAMKVESDASKATLILTLDRSAPVGSHECEIVANFRFNNQSMRMNRPVRVTIESAGTSP